MPYSPYIYRYSASETTPLRKIEREIIYDLASRKSYLVIICPISHFGPDLALFFYIFQYLALLNYIYPHVVIFTLNCRNLTIYAIIIHSTFIGILLVRLRLCAKLRDYI